MLHRRALSAPDHQLRLYFTLSSLFCAPACGRSQLRVYRRPHGCQRQRALSTGQARNDLKKTEEDKKTGQDRFFILEWKELQNLVVQDYTEYLSKHNFVRPKKPESFHTMLTISAVEPFEDKWTKILDRVPSTLMA